MEGKTIKDIIRFQEDCREEFQDRLGRFGERLEEAREDLLATVLGDEE